MLQGLMRGWLFVAGPWWWGFMLFQGLIGGGWFGVWLSLGAVHESAVGLRSRLSCVCQQLALILPSILVSHAARSVLRHGLRGT